MSRMGAEPGAPLPVVAVVPDPTGGGLVDAGGRPVASLPPIGPVVVAPPTALGSVGALLEAVSRYGISTVFAVLLLGFVLVNVHQTNQRLLDTLAEVTESQRELARSMADVSRAVERISVRLERAP